MPTLLLEPTNAKETYMPSERDLLVIDWQYLPHTAHVTMTPTQFSMAFFKALYSVDAVDHPHPAMVQVAFYLSCLWSNQWIEQNELFPPHANSFLNWGLPNTLNPPYAFVPGFDTQHTIPLLHLSVPQLIQDGYICLVRKEPRELAVAVGMTEDSKDVIVVSVPQASPQFTSTAYDIPQPRIECWDQTSAIKVLGALRVNPHLKSIQL